MSAEDWETNDVRKIIKDDDGNELHIRITYTKKHGKTSWVGLKRKSEDEKIYIGTVQGDKMWISRMGNIGNYVSFNEKILVDSKTIKTIIYNQGGALSVHVNIVDILKYRDDKLNNPSSYDSWIIIPSEEFLQLNTII